MTTPEKASDFCDISTGKVMPIGARVQAVKPNGNGNKPVGRIFGTYQIDPGLVLIQFPDGNVRPTTPAKYGLAKVGGLYDS